MRLFICDFFNNNKERCSLFTGICRDLRTRSIEEVFEGRRRRSGFLYRIFLIFLENGEIVLSIMLCCGIIGFFYALREEKGFNEWINFNCVESFQLEKNIYKSGEMLQYGRIEFCSRWRESKNETFENSILKYCRRGRNISAWCVIWNTHVIVSMRPLSRKEDREKSGYK